jgi:hypothetical protein
MGRLVESRWPSAYRQAGVKDDGGYVPKEQVTRVWRAVDRYKKKAEKEKCREICALFHARSNRTPQLKEHYWYIERKKKEIKTKKNKSHKSRQSG